MPTHLWSWMWNNARPIGETLRPWAETVAYGGAGAFLFYKLISGYFIADLSLKVSAERGACSGDQGFDYLAVSANLKKGDRGATSLEDAQVEVCYAGTIDRKRL